jgi:hypothetical protein
MAQFKECCDAWLPTLQPKNPQDGVIQERHRCPTCKGWHVIEFQCVALLGSDDLQCVAVGLAMNPP